jgi:hypothetical protein
VANLVDAEGSGTGVTVNAILFGILGAAVGFRWRAPALVPATLAAPVWAMIAGWLGGRSPGQTALLAVVCVVVLHVGFLGGLALRTLLGR